MLLGKIMDPKNPETAQPVQGFLLNAADQNRHGLLNRDRKEKGGERRRSDINKKE
jgi:hypothetical protein